jgi:hypothetical protein
MKELEEKLEDIIASIKKKIGMGLKINANESLAIFCAYLIKQVEGVQIPRPNRKCCSRYPFK